MVRHEKRASAVAEALFGYTVAEALAEDPVAETFSMHGTTPLLLTLAFYHLAARRSTTGSSVKTELPYTYSPDVTISR
jgi:hypothetical protein